MTVNIVRNYLNEAPFEIESVDALINSRNIADLGEMYIQSYYGGWQATVDGPKGGHYVHTTGGTASAPTVGSPVSVGTIGTGTQIGYYWDLDGIEWVISEQPLYSFMFGTVGDGVTNDTTAMQAFLTFGAGKKIYIGAGNFVIDSVLTVPIYTIVIGAGTGVAGGTTGTTFLYSGTGECIRSAGTLNVVPSVATELKDFRIRKTTQASSLAAMALIAGAIVEVDNVRIDTNNAGYHFQYGVVCDQTEVSTLRRLDIQGPDYGVFCTNGAEYTVGAIVNFTNVITLENCNFNGCGVGGIVHNGGATFTVLGGNINGCDIGIRLSGLNNFILMGIVFEAGTGDADIYLSQFKNDAVTSVGGCSGGSILNCRTSSPTVNCIYFDSPGSQCSNLLISGNRFGNARTGSAIGISTTDDLLNSIIGVNINLGGASKNYLDAGIYTYNSVQALTGGAQLENVKMNSMPGLLSQRFSGIEEAWVFTQSASYNVTNNVRNLQVNSSSTAVNVNLQTGTLGRVITIYWQNGANVVTIDAGVGKFIRYKGVNAQTLVLATLGDAVTLECDSDGGIWHAISEIKT